MILVRRNVLIGGNLNPHLPGPIYSVRLAFRGVSQGAGLIAQAAALIPMRIEDGDRRDSEPMLVAPGESPVWRLGRPADWLRVEAPLGGTALVDIWYATDPLDDLFVPPENPTVMLYDSGAVAAGAPINSGTIQAGLFTKLGVLVDNSLYAGTRTLGMQFVTPDGLAALGGVFNVRAVLASTAEVVTMGHGAITSSLVVTAAVSSVLPPKLVITLSIGGAAAGRLLVWGQ